MIEKEENETIQETKWTEEKVFALGPMVTLVLVALIFAAIAAIIATVLLQ